MQIPVPHPGVEAEMAAVRGRADALLEERLACARIGDDAVGRAMRHAVLGGGKRLRPLLAVLAARDLGAGQDAALAAGCAIELVHAASLILDDLPCMDDADKRRGRPAVHRGFGEDVAVLASVALLSEAFALAATDPASGPDRRAALVAVIAGAVGTGGLVGGQMADLRPAPGAGADHLDAVNDRKTGALFVAAAAAAGIAAGAAGPVRRTLADFAREFGRAFQLLDDIADAEEDDRRGPGLTLVATAGRRAAHSRLAGHVAAAGAALGRLPVPPTRLAGLAHRVLDRRVVPEAAR